MKITRTLVLFALVLVMGALTAPPAHARTRVAFDVSIFYDSLAPYGDWYQSPRYGYVWTPADVGAGWRPYVDGHWAYCDYGWTWVSDYDWGWAPFHYGRWVLDPEFGWVWVPGTEWSPAWVDFYAGNGYIGWAPLPPGVSFGVGFSFAPQAYVFVQDRYFLDSHIGRRVAPWSRNRYLAGRARNVTRFGRVGGTYVNRSFATDSIARVTRQRVPRYRVADVRGPRELRGARARAGQITMFRPAVRSARGARPNHVRAWPGRGVGRGHARGQRDHGPAARSVRPGGRSAGARVDSRSRSVQRSPRSRKPATVHRAPSRGASVSRSQRSTQRRPTANRSQRSTSRRPTVSRSQRSTQRRPTANRSQRSTQRRPTANRSQRSTQRRPTANRSQRSTQRRPTANRSQRSTQRRQAAQRPQSRRAPTVQRSQGRSKAARSQRQKSQRRGSPRQKPRQRPHHG